MLPPLILLWIHLILPHAQAQVIRGVNLGGWLLTESWITPSLYSSVSRPSPKDEWSLCAALGKTGCQSRLTAHYDSFYTLDDIIQIKSAGLTALRIPIPYWSIIPLLPYEPYTPGAYPFLIRAVQWAAQVGLTVSIDLHGVPGSQNGQDNSGLTGPVLFQTNSTNLDRTLAALRNLSSEFSNPIYNGTVTTIELMNEPRISATNFTMPYLKSFYQQASAVVRNASANRLGVVIHDAFYGPEYWAGYSPTTSPSPSWLTLDLHQYFAFPPNNNLPHSEILSRLCTTGQTLRASRSTSSLLPTVIGEWSLETGTAPNSTSGAGGTGYSDSREKRGWLRMVFEAQKAAYEPSGTGAAGVVGGWYFWCWKTEYQIDTWSYSLGISQGWIPPDISNASLLAFPIRADGCIDSGFNYTAPVRAGVQGGSGRGVGVGWAVGVGVGVGWAGWAVLGV